MTIKEQKRLMRAQVRERLNAITPGERDQESQEFCSRMRGIFLWQASRTVLLFWPMQDELDVRPLIGEALSQGRQVFLPRFVQERQEYEVAPIRSLEDLVAGNYGIMEPNRNFASNPGNGLDFALIPGVAFDCSGRRLGRGRGYYDRLLTQIHGHFCGAAFHCQVVPEVPSDDYDVRLNSLLTPSRWVRCDNKRAV